jgi:Spy/CpxP family protein refolding chaperone
MRTIKTLIVSALMLSGVAALAQKPASPCLLQESALQRNKALQDKGVISQEQLQATQDALAECQAQLAGLAAIKAQESANQARLDDLRKKYNDSYPDVVALRAKLDELRAQEASLIPGIPRSTYTPKSLKQSVRGLQTGLPDRWWKNPATAQSLGLTADQQKKMDDVFQQYRLKLIDFNAALEKEEVTLEPLVGAEPLDEAKVAAQIDRVAEARAELEKANGRMLLGIRKLLTPEQWSKLNSGKPL